MFGDRSRARKRRHARNAHDRVEHTGWIAAKARHGHLAKTFPRRNTPSETFEEWRKRFMDDDHGQQQ